MSNPTSAALDWLATELVAVAREVPPPNGLGVVLGRHQYSLERTLNSISLVGVEGQELGAITAELRVDGMAAILALDVVDGEAIVLAALTLNCATHEALQGFLGARSGTVAAFLRDGWALMVGRATV